jgi:hypothetical protein
VKELKMEEERIHTQDDIVSAAAEKRLTPMKQLEQTRLEDLEQQQTKQTLSLIKKAEFEHRRNEEVGRLAREKEARRQLKYEQMTLETNEGVKRRTLARVSDKLLGNNEGRFESDHLKMANISALEKSGKPENSVQTPEQTKSDAHKDY